LKNQLFKIGFISLSLFIFCGKFTEIQAQRKVIQFSGLVVTGEQSVGVPFASVFVPRTSRGAYTNEFGFFSFPLLIGDTCMVKSQGFRPQRYIIPDDGRQSISVVLYLQADTTLLPEVEILPFPTEEDFKRAFLALRLPETDMNRMRQNLNPRLLERMRFNLGMDAGLNHLYFSRQATDNIVNQNFLQGTTQLFNPFAWGQFLRDVKSENERKRRREDAGDE
jgi:hypothetical protein